MRYFSNVFVKASLGLFNLFFSFDCLGFLLLLLFLTGMN